MFFGYELGAQRVGERLGAGRQSGLGAELAEQLLAVRPRQQLGGPVRVGLRSADRDIAGPELRGEVGEDACLEVAAVQAPRVVVVADDALPLLGCERQVDGDAVAVIGDEVAGQVRVRERVLHGVKHAAIRARGLEHDDAREREHRRAVAAAVAREEGHVVVGVMRRDRLDIGELRVEPAGLLDGPASHPQRLSRFSWVARVQAGEDAAVVDDQSLGHLRLALSDLGELCLRELGDLCHPLAEHLGQVVAGPHPGDVDHARQQRRALERGDVAHHAGVGGQGLTGEVGDLRLRYALQPRLRVAERVDPSQVRDLPAKPRP